MGQGPLFGVQEELYHSKVEIPSSNSKGSNSTSNISGAQQSAQAAPIPTTIKSQKRGQSQESQVPPVDQRWEDLVEFAEKPHVIIEVRVGQGSNKVGRIALYSDDDPSDVLEEFCKHYPLAGGRKKKLLETLKQE